MNNISTIFLVLSSLFQVYQPNTIPLWNFYGDQKVLISQNDIFDSKSFSDEINRYYEPAGGFSYIPPEGWTIEKIPKFEYKMLLGPADPTYTPNVHFQKEVYEGSLNEFVSYSLDRITKARSVVTFVESSTFNTYAGLNGYKAILTNQMDGIPLYYVIYFLDAGREKFGITYSRLFSKDEKFDNVIDATIRSFLIETGCSTSLSGYAFDQAMSKISIKLPKGWKVETRVPGNDSKAYVKGDVILFIFAFDTDISPGKCLEETTKTIAKQMNQGNTSVGNFKIGTKEFLIDGHSSEMAVASGYSDVEKMVPLEYAILGISNEGIVYQLSFIATGTTKNNAQIAIDGLIDDITDFVKQISIE